jgi:hypothetical protein
VAFSCFASLANQLSLRQAVFWWVLARVLKVFGECTLVYDDIINGMESHERIKAFVVPDTLAERGEFARVAETFSFDEGVLMHLAKTNGRMVDLTSAIWNELDNTDSNRFEVGDWAAVADHAGHVGRDWQSIKDGVVHGQSYDAPIVMKYRDKCHLVSGNTRLMVARALGLKPRVWLFEVYDNEA